MCRVVAFLEDMTIADHYSPTVIPPSIPKSDMTALQLLLLDAMSTAEPDGEPIYSSSDEGVPAFVTMPRVDLEAALAEFEPRDSCLKDLVAGALANSPIASNPP